MRGSRGILVMAALPLLSQTPTFQTGTNLVEVTVVVRDAQGRTVNNLTVNDFQLFDLGKRQAITHFSLEQGERRDAMVVRGNSGGRMTESVLPNRYLALLVDDGSLVPERFPLATVAAMRHIKELRPGDRVAVVMASGRSILPFTADREKVRKALANMGSLDRRATFIVGKLNSEITCTITYLKADRIREGDAASLQNCVPRTWKPVTPTAVVQRPNAGSTLPGNDDLHQIFLEGQTRAFAESVAQAGDRDVEAYFARLAELIDQMSRLPGARSILLLSPGIYIPQRFRKVQNALIAEAVRAHVVISGVDPRGVYVRNDPDDPSTWTDQWGIAETNEWTGFMEDVTSGTGGRFIRGDNDIAGAIRQLAATPESVYVLGFSPAPLVTDGKYHTLRVALKPHGLTAEARRGYYALAAGGTAEVRDELRDAFFSGREMDGLPVQVEMRSSHKPETKDVLTVISKIGLDAKSTGRMILGVGLFDENGRLAKDVWQEITVETGRVPEIEIKTDFEVDPGRYLVRAVVQEKGGGRTGARNAGVAVNRDQ